MGRIPKTRIIHKQHVLGYSIYASSAQRWPDNFVDIFMTRAFFEEEDEEEMLTWTRATTPLQIFSEF